MKLSTSLRLFILLSIVLLSGTYFPATAQIENKVTIVSPTGSNRPLHSVNRTHGAPFYVKPSMAVPKFAAKEDSNGSNTPSTNPGSGGGGNNGTGPVTLDQDPLLQPFQPTVATQILNWFEGARNTDNPFLLDPADPVGDVGPNHYVEMINLVTTIFDRSGGTVQAPELHSNLFGGTSHDCGDPNKSNGDPIVLYDEQADRWIVTHLAFSFDVFGIPAAPYWECVAVSQTGVPTGPYYLYAFDFSSLGLNDYPKFGITQDAITMTANIFSLSLFGDSYEGQFVGAIDKSTLYAGQPTQLVGMNLGPFEEGFLPADRDDPTGVANPVPDLFATALSTPGYFEIYKMTPDFANPANTTVDLISSIPIAPFDLDICSADRESCIPHAGGGDDLEALSDRLMHRLQIRDFGTHLSMVAALTVDADAAPAGTPGRAGIRWYEMRSTDGGESWSLYQEGTHAPADGLQRWLPSIAMNTAGDIGIGYMVSSATMPVELRVSGQTAANSGTGTFDAEEGICRTGLFGSDWQGRAGDYTSTSVAPDTDTFWYAGQYGSSPDIAGWGTAVCEFQFGDGPVNTAPSVAITAPADGSSYQQGNTISFAGTANDTEDGDISANLEWTSSLDGPIGSGAGFNTSSLSTGTHTIMAAVTDSGGLTRSDSILVTVNATGSGTMHVSSIVLGTQNASRGLKYGTAAVTILDGSGSPVSGATVFGTFSGDYNEDQSGATGTNGTVALVTTNTTKGPTFSFCVSNVIGASLTYDPADNASSGYACGAPANTAPTVTITSPSVTTFSSGQSIQFQATASDSEDGDLSANIVWTSDKDGMLGTGGSINHTLSDGTHTITASVSDSGGLSDSDQVTITVGNAPTPTSLHVDLITTGTVNAGHGSKYGSATITIRDDLGNPVQDAVVEGHFGGTFNEDVVTPIGQLTDANGMVTLTTSETAKGSISVSFCVIGANGPGPQYLTYNAGDDSDPSYHCN